MYPKESVLEKEPPPVVKCDYYRVDRVVTHEFEQDWIDTLEEQSGIRPVIVESFIVTPDVGHHLCSAKKHTLAWSMGYTLWNYHEVDESDDSDQFDLGAEAIEDVLREIHYSEETAKYFGYAEFWKDFQDEDWEPDVRIPDSDEFNLGGLKESGPWIEHMGRFDDSKIRMNEAYEIFNGDYDGDEQ